ncbi:restriction endonuclease subunit S [Aeromonas popoffii]|jgi:type I restriction enzyme S subunit|uniref:restriction endonuclease subunit S n=1 Tax=Aeromonas popoffii TaxID=70856 RepID=UPI0030CDC326
MIAAENKNMTKYQPYPEYKDSGVEWLGYLPTDWRVIKLGFLATKIGSGKTPSGGATVYVDEGITFLRSQNVYDDGLRLDDVVHITPDVDTEMAHSRVKPMDILINITGASIGRTCIVPLGIGSANVNQHVCIIRLNKGELIRFVSWAVKAQPTKAQIDNAQTGAAREGLNFEQIASLLLSLPPETECEQISDFLDYETARIDRLIVQQQRLIELLKEKRQAVISHAVTKGMNPDAPMKDSGVEWLGQVPEHWHIRRLKHHIISMEQGWSPQCEARLAEMGEFGVMKVGCVNGGIFRAGEHKALPADLDPKAEYRLKKGQLLMSRANTRELVGSAAVVDADYDQLLLCDKLYRIKLSSDVSPEFIALLLGTLAYRGQIELSASGASDSMQNIGQSTVKELPIAFPPIDEVGGILKYVTTRLRTFDSLNNQLKQQYSLLQERRTALISAAVTGKIDLRGWIPPADEVAA